MIDYKKLSPEERAMYDEARMTHGQRQQAAEDWRFIQRGLLIGLFILVLLVYFLEPLFI